MKIKIRTKRIIAGMLALFMLFGSMSEYIRSVAKCPPDVTRDEFETSIVRMIYEINKIGVNINQIAKKYNEHNYVEPSEELLCKLDEVYGMMKHTIRIMKGDRNVAHY